MRNEVCVSSGHISYNVCEMKKDAPLAFRIPSELKTRLQHIADREARSISQICELLLTIGTHAYEREGAKYLHRHMIKRDRQ